MNPEEASHSACRTALLAEDDELIRDIVCTYLERLGYEVLEAADGQGALEIIESLSSGSLALVVTDLLMPKKNGEEVIRCARSRGICDRFLIMSGFCENMPRLLRDDEGHSVYLEKPFSFAAFQDRLHSLEVETA